MGERIRSIGRRALLLFVAVASLAAAQQNPSSQPFPDYAGFDHLVLEVTELERSRAFYTQLFGADAWWSGKGDEQYLVLGNTYLQLHRGGQPRVMQVGIGVRDFAVESVQRYLEREELRWHDDAGAAALWVEDGDGVRTLLLEEGSWERIRQDPAVAQFRGTAPDPIFKPLRLDEVGLSVTNLEVDSLFYARLLARNSTLQAGSLWYTFGGSRLRLTQTPMGQHSGVGYFSILISNTDLEAAANAVFAAGGIIETLLPNGFSFWDPDGLRVVVHTTPMI